MGCGPVPEEPKALSGAKQDFPKLSASLGKRSRGGLQASPSHGTTVDERVAGEWSFREGSQSVYRVLRLERVDCDATSMCNLSGLWFDQLSTTKLDSPGLPPPIVGTNVQSQHRHPTRRNSVVWSN